MGGERWADVRVVEIAPSLDYRTVETLYGAVGTESDGPVLFDARRLRWVDPNGMLALLAAGRVVGDRTGSRVRISMPENADVASYLARMGFMEAAAEVFDQPPARGRRSDKASDVLLEITNVHTNSDVHAVVERVQAGAGRVLTHTLHYPAAAVVQFSVVLSEVCQNIIEHAEGPGWVAAQSYNWTKRLGRHVVVIAVSDLGRGFRGSLTDEHSARFGDRWGDVTALEAAFIHGLTRFPDSGRGQGIQQIRKQVGRWGGLLAIRSGTARIADTPEWTEMPPVEDGLTPFPGAQINIILPERTGD